MQIHRGNILFTPQWQKFRTLTRGYLVVDQHGIIVDCYDDIPPAYCHYPVMDHGDHLIIPGFTDAHVHACQLPIAGLQAGRELIDWLEELTFPQEQRFSDHEYAHKIYHHFATLLVSYGITSAIVMGTIHLDSTILLAQQLHDVGVRAYVSKVSRDQHSPESACQSTQQELEDSRHFLEVMHHRFPHVRSAVAPSASLVCSWELMRGLARQAEEFGIPAHMHLAENPREVQASLERFPSCGDLVEIYDQTGLLDLSRSVVAHGIYLNDREKDLLHKKKTLIAHCPHSNLNLLSGIMDLAHYHDQGLRVGLGSDIAGGHTLNMFHNIVGAIQSGAMRFLSGQATRPVSISEAFYCATKGGGEFFGKVGSFEPGYYFDALVIDDSTLEGYDFLSLTQRLEKVIYCGDDRHIKQVYVAGQRIR